MTTIVDFPLQGTIGANLMPKRFDIELYQGDTFKFVLAMTGPSNAVLDTTGWIGLAQIKYGATNLPGETPNMTVTIDAVGNATVTISNTGTAALLGTTTYKYDIQFTDAASNVRTVIGGNLTITEDISE
jgi:hypothetical protein